MATLSLNKGEERDVLFIDEPQLDFHCKQDEGSVLRLFVFDFHTAENVLHIDHLAPNCTTEIYHLAFLHEAEKVSTHTRMHHEIGEGVSRQVIKFVLADRSAGEFLGELRIQPDAQHVDAQQTNRNLLLSKTATMRTRPQLEIYADDVKASHGATTGQLDESALFYMQQRCIDPEEGRRMLLRAFMADIVEKLNDPQSEKIVNEKMSQWF
ncbi:MAG: SufD family Fe-S cluster assembly protein [Paludibacteraceae bacterium]|nr:SufD family Fe-S cluster assembly protein [Paludibacteraceae bacterium]